MVSWCKHYVFSTKNLKRQDAHLKHVEQDYGRLRLPTTSLLLAGNLWLLFHRTEHSHWPLRVTPVYLCPVCSVHKYHNIFRHFFYSKLSLSLFRIKNNLAFHAQHSEHAHVRPETGTLVAPSLTLWILETKGNLIKWIKILLNLPMFFVNLFWSLCRENSFDTFALLFYRLDSLKCLAFSLSKARLSFSK